MTEEEINRAMNDLLRGRVPEPQPQDPKKPSAASVGAGAGTGAPMDLRSPNQKFNDELRRKMRGS